MEYYSNAVEKAEQNFNMKKKASRSLELIRAYKRVFSSPDGNKILNDLMKSCSFTRTTLSQGADLMLFNEGRRSVILNIHEILGKDTQAIYNQITAYEQKEKENYL